MKEFEARKKEILRLSTIDLRICITKIEAIVKKGENPCFKTFLMLKSRLYEVEKNNKGGLLSKDDYNQEIAILRRDILDFITELDIESSIFGIRKETKDLITNTETELAEIVGKFLGDSSKNITVSKSTTISRKLIGGAIIGAILALLGGIYNEEIIEIFKLNSEPGNEEVEDSKENSMNFYIKPQELNWARQLSDNKDSTICLYYS